MLGNSRPPAPPPAGDGLRSHHALLGLSPPAPLKPRTRDRPAQLTRLLPRPLVRAPPSHRRVDLLYITVLRQDVK